MKHLLSIAVLGLLLAGCGGTEAPTTDTSGATDADVREIRVETLLIEPSGFSDTIEMTGTIESLDDATLSAQANGTIQSLAPLGSYVARGSRIAQVDMNLADAALEQTRASLAAAQANLDLAEDTYARQAPLVRDSVISRLEFNRTVAQRAQALAQVAQARAAVRQAEKQRSNTVVVAPFNGVIEEHFVERGEQIAMGMPVARLVSTARVRVTTGVPERYVTDIQRGTPVRIRFSAYNLPPMVGNVTFVGSAIDPNARTFPIEVELPNPNGQLKPQMIADLEIVRSAVTDAIVVPQTAVMRDEMGAAVFVVENGIAQRREVIAGANNAGLTQITSGLLPGDEVVVVGQQNLTTGDAVEVVEQRRVVRPETDDLVSTDGV